MTTKTKKKKEKKKKKKISSVWITLRNTSAFSDEQVWDALRHVVPPLRLKTYREVDVTVSRSSGYSAVCYHKGCSWHDTSNPLVIARVTAAKNYFPHQTTPTRGGYIPKLWLNSMECLIALLAHEFRHLWHYEHTQTRRGRVWGARGVASDRDSDAYAIRKVREYRRTSPERLQEYEHKVSEAVVNLLPPTLLIHIATMLKLVQ